MARNAYKKSVFPLIPIAESPDNRLTLGSLRSTAAAAAKNRKNKRAAPLDYDETEVDEDIENLGDYDNLEDADDNNNNNTEGDDYNDDDDDESDVHPITALRRGSTIQKKDLSRAQTAAVAKRSTKGTAAMPANKATKRPTRTSSTAAAAPARKAVPETPVSTAMPLSKAATVAESAAAAGAKRQRKAAPPPPRQQQQQQRKQQEQELQQQNGPGDSDHDEDMDDQLADEYDRGGVRARADNAPALASVEDSTLEGLVAAPQDGTDLSGAAAAAAAAAAEADENAAARPKKRSRSVKTAKASAPEPVKRLKSEAAGGKRPGGRGRLVSHPAPPQGENDDEEEMIEEEEDEAMVDERPRTEAEPRGRKGSKAKNKAAEAVQPRRGAKRAAATGRGRASVDESNIIARHEQRVPQTIHEAQTSQLDMYDTLGGGAGAGDGETENEAGEEEEEEEEEEVEEADEPTLQLAGRTRYGSRAPSETRQVAPPGPRTTTTTRTRAASQPMTAAPELALVPVKARGRRGGGMGAAVDSGGEVFTLAGGSAGPHDKAQSEPVLRRQLGETTRRFDELQRRHQNLLQNLRQVGIEEAEANLERLKKQIHDKNQAAENLAASLRTEVAAQASLAKKTRASLDAARTKLDAAQAELAATRSKLDAAQTALALRDSDNGALRAKAEQLASALEAAEASGKAQQAQQEAKQAQQVQQAKQEAKQEVKQAKEEAARAAEAASRAQAKAAADAARREAHAKLAEQATALAAAQADIKALRTKLDAAERAASAAEAARKAAAAATAAPSASGAAASSSSALGAVGARGGAAATEQTVPGSALKKTHGNGGGVGGSRRAAVGTAAAGGRGPVKSEAQLKEELYSDLTGLVLAAVNSTNDATVFDCVQTGSNGTLHYKLTVPLSRKRSNTTGKDERRAFFTPQVEEQRDHALLAILPKALKEEIEFPFEQIDELYRRLRDALCLPPPSLEEDEEDEEEEEEGEEGQSEYTEYTATTTPGRSSPGRAAITPHPPPPPPPPPPPLAAKVTTATVATPPPRRPLQQQQHQRQQQQRQKEHGQVKHEEQGQAQGQQGAEGAKRALPPSGTTDAKDADEEEDEDEKSYMDETTTVSQMISSPELRLDNF